MCFSAGASFTAGAMLTFVAVETYRKVHKPAQMALASIPVFFAVQQFAEGVVWLTIGQAGHEGLRAFSSYVFLIMAQAVWPVLVPLSALLLEENKARKKIMYWLFGTGAAVAAYYAYGLAVNAVSAKIIGLHIVYRDTGRGPDLLGVIVVLFYLIAVLTPLFASSIKRVYLIGIIMSVSFIVSALFYLRALTSVWCFFAAMISFVVFYIISDAHKIFHFNKNKEKDKQNPAAENIR